MGKKQATLRIDVSQETGEVMLLINTVCGNRPVMCWPDVDSFQDFARKLLVICDKIQRKAKNSWPFLANEWLEDKYNGN